MMLVGIRASASTQWAPERSATAPTRTTTPRCGPMLGKTEPERFGPLLRGFLRLDFGTQLQSSERGGGSLGNQSGATGSTLHPASAHDQGSDIVQ
jgi:hypothetical protein